MKKVFAILLLLCAAGFSKAQSSDTLLRAAGFYLSPCMTDFYFSNSDMKVDPELGFSAGFRYTNKLKNGFFIEGGAGLALFRGKYPVSDRVWTVWTDWSTYVEYPYKTQTSVTEINLIAPFLVGYRTGHGKVRFQGSLGIAFDLRPFQIEKTTVVEGNSHFAKNGNKFQLNFGTSFLAVARAGISIPLHKRMTLDILPTARYRFAYFTIKDRDLTKSIRSGESPWLLGLDVGITWALDNREPEQIYEYEYNKPDNTDFTIAYKDSSEQMQQIKKKLLNTGYKNFIYLEFFGNGITYTMNYERKIFSKRAVNIQVRGGAGFVAKKYSVPVGANIAFGVGRNKFEAGLTTTFNNFNRDLDQYDADYNKFNLTIDPSIAFRLEFRNHFFLRLSVMTHYFPITGGLLPGGGISAGGAF